MRKALILTAAMFFALAGFAAADASLDGLSVKSEIFFEGVSLDLGKVAYDTGKTVDYSGNFLNGRGRFFLNYSKADWKGVLGLEIGEFTWNKAKEKAGTAQAYLGTSTARDQMIVEVKHLYVQGPIGPLTLTAGLQPIALGYSTILDEDYVAINLTTKVGAGTAGLAYIKVAETMFADKDATAFALYYAGAFSGISLKPYGIYVMNDDDAAGDYYFIGLPVGGKFGAVDFIAEIDYLGGDMGALKSLSEFGILAKANFGLGAANVYVMGGYSTKDMKQIAENLTFDIVLEDAYFRRGAMGLQNFMFGKVGADYTMGALKLDAGILFDQQVDPSKSYGTEIDIAATYKLTDSLSLWAGYGYLMAGDLITDDQYKASWKATFKY